MSMWTRQRHRTERRTFREELAGRAVGKIGCLFWLILFIWAVCRSIAYGLFLTISTWPGRVLGIAAVVALLVDASWGVDPLNLPVGIPLIILVAGVAGYVMWTQRRRLEEHLSTIVYDVVPGHSRSQPEVIWFPPAVGRRVQGGRWLRTWDFMFRIPGGMSESKQAEVEQNLRSRLPAATGASWAFAWDWRRGVARVTLIRDLPSSRAGDEPLRRMSDASRNGTQSPEEREKAATRIPLGRSREIEIIWDCSNLFGSILVVGAPGGGKSVVTLTILSHCFEFSDMWTVYCIDLKRVELGPLRRFKPHPVVSVATNLDDALGVLEEVQEEMESRYEMLEEEGFNNIRKLNKARRSRGEKAMKHVMVALDEIAELVEEQGGKSEKEDDEKRGSCKKRMNSIVRLGRAAGIHLILATQRPDAEYIPGSTKSNIQARVALGGLSETGSQMAIEDPAASNLPGEPGRGIWFESGRLTEFQGYLTEDEDLDSIVEEVTA